MEVIVKRKADYDDELRHFKYIKREKKNGKWVYYYDTKSLKKDVYKALGGDEKKQYKKAKKEYDKAGAEAITADKNYYKMHDFATKARNNGDDVDKIAGVITNKEKATLMGFKAAAEKKWAKWDKAESKLEKARAKYEKTPLAKIDKAAAAYKKAKKSVELLFKGVKLYYKGKKTVAKVKRKAKNVSKALSR